MIPSTPSRARVERIVLEQEIQRSLWNVRRILLFAGLIWISLGVSIYLVLHALVGQMFHVNWGLDRFGNPVWVGVQVRGGMEWIGLGFRGLAGAFDRTGHRGAGAIGVGLASIGVYGIVSFDVMRRTREIGIRMALGARQSQVIRLVLSDMTGVVVVGAMVGVVLSIAVTRAVRGILFGVAPGSPVATVIAVAVLTLAAAAAGYLPARRASAVDPTQALRHE